MDFHDVRLPVDITRNYSGGAVFLTTIVNFLSGFEARDSKRSMARGEWDLGYPMSSSQYENIIAFFYARAGAAHSFRFKDWVDFVMNRQLVMTTDGSEDIQFLFKRYTSGGINYDRLLTKIVSGSVSVWVNNIAQTVIEENPPSATEVRINLLTGRLKLGSTHAATSGEAVEVALEFDVPVRFQTDKLNVSMPVTMKAVIPSIPVIEVRGE